jgi:succinate dehydrogenase / fumarate reductase cytochrome b subunit
MQRALTLYSTTVGKKVAMALSGAILLGFTIVHMAGNMNLFAGQEAFDGYAAKLREMPILLWTARIGLIFAFLTHVFAAAMLFFKNSAARSIPYKKKKDIARDYAAKTMYLSGPILFFYVLFHLAHMTFAQTFGLYEWSETSPYDNLVHGFQHWVIIAPYVLGVLALGLHLFHGIFSAFQSMGINHPQYNHLRRDLAIGLATLLTIGNLSFPFAVKMGYVRASDDAGASDFGESGSLPPLPIPLP